MGPFCRFGHRLKTHGRWRLRQPDPGTFVLRSPTGYIFLVNHTGTHELGKNPFAHAIWRNADLYQTLNNHTHTLATA